MIKQYVCEYCGEVFSRKDLCGRHEQSCEKRPADAPTKRTERSIAARKAAQEAKARGGPWGRPRRKPPEELKDLYTQWCNGEKSISKFAYEYDVSLSTMRRWFKELEDKES